MACLVLACTALIQELSVQELNAQELSLDVQREVDSLQKRVDTFFVTLTDKKLGSEGAAERAIRELIGNGPLKDRTDDINKLIEQAIGLELRYGAYTGHEEASVKAIGSDLVLLRHLYKSERFPVVWHFTFYRTTGPSGTKRDWALIGLKFDSKLDVFER